jgi:periplasmic divalent cation tolerance protein
MGMRNAREKGILVYATCRDRKEAERISRALLKKRLGACAVVIPNAISYFLWPPGKGMIEKSREAVLLIKTLRRHLRSALCEIEKLHSYEAPGIFFLPVERVGAAYFAWMRKELS